MSYWIAGGFPMVFVLVFGLVAIASSLRFALAPTANGARAITAYAVAVGCVSVAGAAVDFVNVARFVGSAEASDAELFRILVVGVSECLSPIILGASLVAIAFLGVAIGTRRLPQ